MFHLLISYSVTFINDHVLITTNQGSKKLAFHLALQTSSSQLLLALGKSSFTTVCFLLINLVGRWLGWEPVRMEVTYRVWQENLLVLDDQMTLVLSSVRHKQCILATLFLLFLYLFANTKQTLVKLMKGSINKMMVVSNTGFNKTLTPYWPPYWSPYWPPIKLMGKRNNKAQNYQRYQFNFVNKLS